MRKVFILFMALAMVAGASAADYTASQAGNWSNSGTWGGAGVPAAGDNVITNGIAVTVSADATCDNLTYTAVAGQLILADGVTLTVRGQIDCPTSISSNINIFAGSNDNSTVELTGAISPFPTGNVLITPNAANGMSANNIIINTTPGTSPSTTQYTFDANNYAPATGVRTGTFTVKAGSNFQMTTREFSVGTLAGNGLIIEEGAMFTSGHTVRGTGNGNAATFITVNGTLISAFNVNAKALTIGSNGTLKTAKSDRSGTFLDSDGWWGHLTSGTTVNSFVTPTQLNFTGNAIIEFNKGGTQNVPGTVATSTIGNTVAPYSIPYVNLKLSGSGTKTVRSNLTFTGTLTVDAGVTMVIPTGVTLNVAAGAKLTNAGTITNNGTINIQSDATNGTGTILNTGTMGGSGITNVNQYLTNDRSWYITNPLNTAASPAVASGTIALKKYDETLVTDPDGLTGWATTTDPLVVGKGYLSSVSATGSITFTGTLNNGNISLALTSRTGTTNKAGFNLIGNPYPSYLDWSLVTASNGSTILRSTTMWYRTKKLNDLSQLVYQFWTVNGDGVNSPKGASPLIPPMQAFWVRAAEGGNNLALTNAMRKHAPTTDFLLKVPAAKNLGRTLVRLEVSNGVNTYEAVIYFSENAQNGLDMLDAPKMSNGNSAIPEIHTSLGNEKIVINAMNSIPMDTPIGLGFVAGNATSFSLRANEISNLPEGVKLMLRDNVTFAETDLTDGVSTYTFAPEETSIDRFSVIFRSAGVATGINNAINSNLSAYYNNSKITVLCGDDKLIGSELSIYNAVGQKIVSKQLLGSKMQVDGTFVPGVYVLKVNNITTKMIVK